ncbi:hypothetical protein K8Q93_02435 [Candidatus Parcubacteria bacterium]|nr:hypothetical protein [Candidatus Parcubacteria bacterium]
MDDGSCVGLSGADKAAVFKAMFDAEGCISFPAEPLVLSSGILSPVFFDMQRLPSVAAWRGIIALFGRVIDPSIRRIAGVYSGGVFHAPTIGYTLGKEHICVRPAHDESGKGRPHVLYSGNLSGSSIILVEDAVTTAGSLTRAATHLRSPDVGAVVKEAVSILSYDFAETRENLVKAGIVLYSLVTLAELISEMLRREFIPEKKAALVREWHKDPRAFRF